MISDICVHVRNKPEDNVHEDCSCDSSFMLSVMDEIGYSIRNAYHCVDKDNECILVMDIVGGMIVNRRLTNIHKIKSKV